MATPARYRTLLRWIGRTTAVVLAVAGAAVLFLHLDYFAGDFLNNLWGPAYHLVHGQSPYWRDPLLQENPPLWLPPAIGLFFPLGWLDFRLAANLWFLVNLAALLAIVLWCRRQEGSALPWQAASLVLFFPALSVHFLLGQYGLLSTWLLLLAAGLLGRGRPFLAGLILTPALAKPQLALLAVPALWVAAVRRWKARGAVLLPAGALLGSGLLTLPLWLAYPTWTADFLLALHQNPEWFQPTLFGVLPLWLGPAGWVLAGAVALAALALGLWLSWTYPPEESLPWSLGLTTVASPYLWTWDMVLLLPLSLRAVARQRCRLARWLWTLGPIVCWGLILGQRMLTDGSDHWHFWVPWFFLGLILAGQALAARASPAERFPPPFRQDRAL